MANNIKNTNNFIEDSTLFDIGGFKLQRNISKSNSLLDKSYIYEEFIPNNTILAENQDIDLTVQPDVNLDIRTIYNYIKYSNVEYTFNKIIEKIILTYPPTLTFKNSLFGRSNYSNNITNIVYNQYSNITTFVLSTNYIDNPFNYNFTIDGSLNNYIFDYLDVKYLIQSIQYPKTLNNSFIQLKVKGDIFNGQQTISSTVYVTPSSESFNSFFNSLSKFEQYFLQSSFSFFDIRESDVGVVYDYELQFTFPKIDKYNIDFNSDNYTKFYKDLIEFARKQDNYNSNIFLAQYVTDSLKSITIQGNNDNPTFGKINQIFTIYSNIFDKLNSRIKNIRHYSHINYENVNTIIDRFKPVEYKNYGLDIVDNNLFNNIFYLNKSKGTQFAIDFINEYYNVPKELLEISSFEYKLGSNLNYDYTKKILEDINLDINNFPIDNNGQIILSGLDIATYENFIPDNQLGLLKLPFDKEYYTTLYDNNFDSNIHLNYKHFNNQFDISCFTSSGDIIEDVCPDILLDECGCPIDGYIDKSYSLNNNVRDIYDGFCPPIIVDAIPVCGLTEITYQISSEVTTIETNTCSTGTQCNNINYDLNISTKNTNGLIVTYEVEFQTSSAYTNFTLGIITDFLSNTLIVQTSTNTYDVTINFDPDPIQSTNFNIVMNLVNGTCNYTDTIDIVVGHNNNETISGVLTSPDGQSAACPSKNYTNALSVVGVNGNIVTFQSDMSIESSGNLLINNIEFITIINGQEIVINTLVNEAFQFSINYFTTPPTLHTFSVTVEVSDRCNCDYELNYTVQFQTGSIGQGQFNNTSTQSGTYDVEVTEIVYTAVNETVQFVNYQLNVIGGTSPYEIVGNPSNNFLLNDPYSFSVIDSSGCTSMITSGITVTCENCTDNNLSATINYDCVTGVILIIEGGVMPYQIIGAKIGEMYNDGQIISSKIIDAVGCEYVTNNLLIDCYNVGLNCFNIQLDSSLETIIVDKSNYQSTLVLTHNISSLSLSVYVESIKTTVNQINGSQLVGQDIINNFTTADGAAQYLFDFDPNPFINVIVEVTIEILLTNGCIYIDTYQLNANSGELSSNSFHNKILIAN